jgi:hypothetical protein
MANAKPIAARLNACRERAANFILTSLLGHWCGLAGTLKQAQAACEQ